MRVLITLTLIVTLFSCDQKLESDKAKRKDSVANSQLQNKSNNISDTVSTNIQFDNNASGENLFGRFFCDRAEFYIIEKPSHSIYSTSTESITLFYLDGNLKQTKYNLQADIVNQLIKDFGNFKIIGYDQKNKNIITSQQVMIKSNNKNVLNQKLDNFEIRWKFVDKEIRYRLNLNDSMKYTYTERDVNYEKEFLAVERFCV